MHHENNAVAGHADGFTLLELLISMFLILLVVLITSGAMRMCYRSVSWGDKKTVFQERFRAALPIIDTQIQSALPVGLVPTVPGGPPDDMQRTFFKGDNNEMSFATNYSIWDDRQGYLVVTYRVVREAGGSKSLYVSESTLGMQAKREALLFESADEIYFQYFSASAVESGYWANEWKQAGAFPEKVWVRIYSRNKDFSLVVPMRVKSNMVRTIAALDGKAINAGWKYAV